MTPSSSTTKRQEEYLRFGELKNGHVSGGSDKGRGICDFVFASDLRAHLSSAAAAQGLETSILLLVVFQESLRRYTGQNSVVVRFLQDYAHPCNVTLAGNLPVREIVQEIQRSGALASRVHLSTVAVDAQFSFQKKYEASDSPLHCSLAYFNTELSGFIEYDRKTWGSAVIEGLAASYQYLLHMALCNLDLPIGQLEILSDSEIQTLETWNRTEQAYPSLSVDQLFLRRVQEAPGHIAITFEGRSLTYLALSEQMNQLAARLRAIGVGPGTLVGICMDRCNEMVIALLAVFRAGGAYLPLDPAFPPDRIAFMQEDARPLAVITQSHLREKFSFRAPHVLCLEPAVTGTPSVSVPEILPHPNSHLDDLAYVLYTSGSTGKPKGVQITRRALTNLLNAVAPALPIEKSDVFLASSTISFDISAFEIFAPLISGAHLVVAPRSTAVSGVLLADAIQTSGATLLQATPSGWRILLEAGWQGQPALKMLTAGEPLDRTLARRLLERGAGLWNLYGPTEATIYATGYEIPTGDTKITIGRPLANYTAYVLDHNGKRVPIGAIGELYLGGVGVARGYLNRAELTAEKFVRDPFSSASGVLYRTGDLARFLADGQIELLGRADNQIKLRGYRIELEEIESVLDSHPGVRKSVVKMVDLGEGDQRLIAYVIPQNAVLFEEAQLREYALRSLPPYAVPASFIAVESLALTPSGKVDRKALPAFVDVKLLHTAVPSEMPADELEATVLDCWRTVLNIPHVDLDHDFFAVGGHSLLAARMFAKLDDRLGLKLPISLLVEAPTPRLVADRIRKIKQSPIKCLVRMQTKGSLRPLYLVHHLFGDILLYRALAECFAPDRPVTGIQAPEGLAERSERCSLKSLAAGYVQELLERQASGPFHLAGFSSGSVLAFEMASQLKELGHEVGLLALIDGDINAPGPALSKPVKYAKIASRKLCKIVFKFHDEIKEGPRQFIAKRIKYWHLVWSVRRLKNSPALPETKLTLQQALFLAESDYRPQPYSGRVVLLRFHDEAWKFGPDPLMGWGGLVQGGIEVFDFPGGHITGMSSARAARVANILKSRMEK
ncbi:MAG TPA: amino acid adenylation domain-containing protein [Bryobacteraceae bacterium]